MSVNPVVVGLDPERDDAAPLILAAARSRGITGAPLIASRPTCTTRSATPSAAARSMPTCATPRSPGSRR